MGIGTFLTSRTPSAGWSTRWSGTGGHNARADSSTEDRMDIDAFGRRPVRIRVGRLIDGTSDEVLEGPAAVLVVDGRIAAVGPDERVPRPDEARDFDFPGATALPGLIDNHVHVTLPPTVDPLATLASETDEQLVARGAVAAERMVRAGVTTAVDLGARGSTGFKV